MESKREDVTRQLRAQPSQAAREPTATFEFSLCEPVVIVGLDKDTAEPAALSPA
jgi:hypothetical protein